MTAHRGRPGAALLLLQGRETDHRRQVAHRAAAAGPLATAAADRSGTAIAQKPTTLPTTPPPLPKLRLEPPPLPLPKLAIPPPRLPTAASRDPATLPTSMAALSLTSATGARASVPEELSPALASAGALALTPPPRASPLRATSAAVARARAF